MNQQQKQHKIPGFYSRHLPLFCMKLNRSSRNSFLFGSLLNSYSWMKKESDIMRSGMKAWRMGQDSGTGSCIKWSGFGRWLTDWCWTYLLELLLKRVTPACLEMRTTVSWRHGGGRSRSKSQRGRWVGLRPGGWLTGRLESDTQDMRQWLLLWSRL